MDLEKLFLLVVSRSKNRSFVRPIYGILTGKVSYCLQFRYSLCFVLDLDAESTRTFVSQKFSTVLLTAELTSSRRFNHTPCFENNVK